jgi:hypothetical protein
MGAGLVDVGHVGAGLTDAGLVDVGREAKPGAKSRGARV